MQSHRFHGIATLFRRERETRPSITPGASRARSIQLDHPPRAMSGSNPATFHASATNARQSLLHEGGGRARTSTIFTHVSLQCCRVTLITTSYKNSSTMLQDAFVCLLLRLGRLILTDLLWFCRILGLLQAWPHQGVYSCWFEPHFIPSLFLLLALTC